MIGFARPHMRSLRSFVLIALAAVLASPGVALAQIDAPTLIEEVDPSPEAPAQAQEEAPPAEWERPPPRRSATPAARVQPASSTDPSLQDAERPRSGAEPLLERAAPPAPPSKAAVEPAVARQPASAEPASAPARPGPRPIIVPTATDLDLLAAYGDWRKASAAGEAQKAKDAQQRLLTLKQELGITDLEPFSVGFIRASEARRTARDALLAIELAQAAVELAPGLPYAHVQLAHAYLSADSTALGRYFGAMKSALSVIASDPYYARPAAADLGAAVVLALLVAASAVVLVLVGRRFRYFLHDFHHLFPRSTAHWQSAVFAVLLLSLPVVFRLGVAPTLLVLFAAVVFYLTTAERLVGALCIGLLGVVPLLAGSLVDRSAFVGTVAEDVYHLERGGLAAAAAAARVEARASLERASFEELYAVGRYRLRRGEVPAAIDRLKKAAVKRSNDPRLLTNLANAMLASGDQEGAADLYVNASQADATLAAAYYNLSRLHYRRVSALPDDLVPQEIDRAGKALDAAKQLDRTLAAREVRPARLTDEQWEQEKHKLARLLVSPPLRGEEVAALALAPDRAGKVRAQVAGRLLGNVSPGVGMVYPLLGALGLVAFGLLRQRATASAPCDKCGRPVCRRCDPELSVGSSLCNQCVNAFARKNAVGPAVRARKQVEIERYHHRTNRISYALGMVVSGAGHLFSGLTIRGALYTFGFVFLVCLAVMKDGVIRVPHGQLPDYLVLIPVGVAFLTLYGLSLRGLYKRQAEES